MKPIKGIQCYFSLIFFGLMHCIRYAVTFSIASDI